MRSTILNLGANLFLAIDQLALVVIFWTNLIREWMKLYNLGKLLPKTSDGIPVRQQQKKTRTFWNSNLKIPKS